jgi:hypothetical protein
LFLASGERSCSPGKKIRRSMPSRKASGRSRCDRLHGSGKGKLCKWSIFEIYNTLKFWFWQKLSFDLTYLTLAHIRLTTC